MRPVVAPVAAAFVGGILKLLLRSWFAMLVFGAVHDACMWQVPALSYTATVAVAVLVGLLVDDTR